MRRSRPLLRLAVLLFSLLPLLWAGGQMAYGGWVLHRRNAWKEDGSEARWFEANKPLHLPSPGADAVLLVHGFADGPSVWERMAPVFSREGFEVAAPLLFGSLANRRRQLDRAVRRLRDGEEDRHVWLVGHSLGGTLAFDAALREENRIAGVAAIAPFFDPAPRRTLGLTPKQWHGLVRSVFPAVVLVDQRTAGHPRLDGEDAEGSGGIRTWPFLADWDYECLFAAADAVRDRAGDWSGPLRVDVASRDGIVDAGAVRRFFREATNASPARLAEHPSGHVLPLSGAAEELAGDIARFFREAAPAR